MLFQDKKAYSLNQKKNLKKIVRKHSLLQGEKELSYEWVQSHLSVGQKMPQLPTTYSLSHMRIVLKLTAGHQ